MLKKLTICPEEVDLLLPVVGMSQADLALDESLFVNRLIEKFGLTDDPLQVIHNAVFEVRAASNRPFRMVLGQIAAHDRTGEVSRAMANFSPEDGSPHTAAMLRALFALSMQHHREAINRKAVNAEIRAAADAIELNPA